MAAAVVRILKRTWFKRGTRLEHAWDFYEKKGYGGMYSRDPMASLPADVFLRKFWQTSCSAGDIDDIFTHCIALSHFGSPAHVAVITAATHTHADNHILRS